MTTDTMLRGSERTVVDIKPFAVHVEEAILEDLRRRLKQTRWPERETVNDRSQGVPLGWLKDLCGYWADQYDWRRCETRLNGWPQYRTEINGLGIHFLHVKSPNEDALPLIMTHGWPGSIVEFLKVIEPLTNPEACGGHPQDAFHLVIPSLPGYGFSDKPQQVGWNVATIADAWAELMRRLGYRQFVAQGGDWGSVITTALAQAAPAGLRAIHLNAVAAFPPEGDAASLSEREAKAVADFQHYLDQGLGYAKVQSTVPQTIGYALADSPAAQAAWIFEKIYEWSDCDSDPWSVFTKDEILDNIMIYWLTNTGASSARLYWQSFAAGEPTPVSVPLAATIFPKEIIRPARRWAERIFTNIIYWNEAERGGHFAALERPETFVEELRTGFRSLR